MRAGIKPAGPRRGHRGWARPLAVLIAVGIGTLLASGAAAAKGHGPSFHPIDPQNYALPEDQTPDEYKPVPGTDWGNPALTPSIEKWRVALVLVDFPDQNFVISESAPHSTIFGNPQDTAFGIPRDDVPDFYADYLNTPSLLNNGLTMNKYWMENSLGRYGVELVPFGPYRMAGNAFEYNLRDAGNAGSACPAGYGTCNRNIRADALAAWRADQGPTINTEFDNIFYVLAGQDESGSWQEFGEMKFQTMDDVTDALGNPDPLQPNWAPTRYVPWTSFASAASIWPSASGNSSTEAESSGMGVYAHELSHNLGIGDNYNNPYGIPLRRSYTGPWDMLSRGSFNGPGGPHTRWHIPSNLGSSLGSNHNVRNRIKLGFLQEQNLLRLDRNALAESGLVVADVTARAADPGPTGLTGVNIALLPSPTLADPTRGDQTEPCVVADNADCPGPTRTGTGAISASSLYNNYTLEVVQRIGNDSFTTGHGVLVQRTKNADSAPFVWTIDAHPDDIGVVDFARPNGEEAMYSFGDYRQLSDATFNAGLGSGTEYEYEDTANRLHFYVLDVDRRRDGVLSYALGVRSLDGSGPQPRGVKLGRGDARGDRKHSAANCVFPLKNTGGAGPIAGTHPEDVSAYLTSDIYRVSASIRGHGWSAQLYNAFATAEAGDTTAVSVYVTKAKWSDSKATVTLTATSESDPTKTATAKCDVKQSDLKPDHWNPHKHKQHKGKHKPGHHEPRHH